MNSRFRHHGARASLLCCTALVAVASARPALAQGGGGSPGGSPTEQPSPSSSLQGAAAPAGGQAGGPTTASTATGAGGPGTALQEIVVTAQKRTQNLQDVPISVTAVTASTLQAQRINNVTDLGSVTPNLTVRNSAGSVGLPTFSMRGITSYGVVPGSDKEISIYIDGVYLGSSVGSAFDLADIERVEVLHGPQGTLFGRNATAGAISVITPDPPNRFGLHQEISFGNYDEKRTKTRLDTGTFGPFSATFSYVHDERNGDVKNLGAGTVWVRPEPGIDQPERQASPKYLGSKDANEYFGALRFHPDSKLNVVYKFDYGENHFTPEAVAPVGVNPGYLGPEGGFVTAVLATQTNPVNFDTSVKRPDAVNNAYTTPGYQRTFGHNLTATYQITDNLSIRNIASYRTSFIYNNDQLDGLGGLSVTPALAGFIPTLAPLVGSSFEFLVLNNVDFENQWSDEPQINYDSKYLTLTLGALFFHQNTQADSLHLATEEEFAFLPGNVIPPGQAAAFNRGDSTAGYIQAEVHVLPQVDIVGGYRTTTDHKTGSFLGGGAPISFTYDNTKPSYLLGVNYKPLRDILLYVKYSTAFVSGGAVGPVGFAPETAHSYEGGFKTDFLHRRLQADLSVFDVSYTNIQSAQSGLNVGQPELATVIIDQGGEKARGFEFQGSALPIRGMTLGFASGFTDFHFTSLNPILGTLQTYLPSLEPKWTVDLSAQYETEPLFGTARLLFRSDANWRSRERYDANNTPALNDAFPGLVENPSAWELSARVALEHIELPYGSAQIALWGKNLTQDRSGAFPGDYFFEANSTFVPARTYGIDLIYDY